MSRRRVAPAFQPKKRVPEPRFGLKLGPHIIKSVTSAKLLGVHIDQELRWKEQGASALSKGQAWLAQRRAALAITGALSSTPTDVLDAYANLLPVRFLVERVRYRAALRLASLPATHPLHRSVADAARRPVKDHRTPLHDMAAEFGIKPAAMEKITTVRFAAEWESSLAVSMRSSKDEAMEEEKKDKPRWKAYTDGSGIDGMIGAAAVLYRDGEEVRSSRLRLGLDTDHTVYEGEGVGISLGLGLLWAEREIEGEATIVVDSQAAIKATANFVSTPSHYIWDTIHRHAATVQRKHPNI
ncbi:hypothetical protein C8R45DRAFT_1180601 [Mycena sanguinolenta]|nr:hypothetical protein C8R45DRAFT_1180601 [Mycena sanguinolenta]